MNEKPPTLLNITIRLTQDEKVALNKFIIYKNVLGLFVSNIDPLDKLALKVITELATMELYEKTKANAGFP